MIGGRRAEAVAGLGIQRLRFTRQRNQSPEQRAVRVNPRFFGQPRCQRARLGLERTDLSARCSGQRKSKQCHKAVGFDLEQHKRQPARQHTVHRFHQNEETCCSGLVRFEIGIDGCGSLQHNRTDHAGAERRRGRWPFGFIAPQVGGGRYQYLARQSRQPARRQAVDRIAAKYCPARKLGVTFPTQRPAPGIE